MVDDRGSVRVRSLTPDEAEEMKAYLDFVQADPVPSTSAALEARMAEAAERWPRIAKMFEARFVSECDHSGQRRIDRATGDEWCEDCGALNPR